MFYLSQCFKRELGVFSFIRNYYIRNWQVAFQKIVLNTLINGVGIAYIILNDEYKAKKTKVFSFTYVDGSFIFLSKSCFWSSIPFIDPVKIVLIIYETFTSWAFACFLMNKRVQKFMRSFSSHNSWRLFFKNI